jgi:hypothetical protein
VIEHLFEDTFDVYVYTESQGTGGDVVIDAGLYLTAQKGLFEPLSASERKVDMAKSEYFTTDRLYCSTGLSINQEMLIKNNSNNKFYDIKGIYKYEKGWNPHWELELSLLVKGMNIADLPISPSEVPENYNSNGIKGQYAYDDDYFYLCVSTNRWIRIAGYKNW